MPGEMGGKEDRVAFCTLGMFIIGQPWDPCRR